MPKSLIVVFFMLVFTLLLVACTENPGGDIKTTTFKMLADIRNTKKKEVLSELKKLLEKSNKALKDKVLIKAFFNLRKNAGKQFEGDLVPHYEFKIDKAYVKKYYDFYDILFVDVSGYIFHTVRRESDYRDNIFYGRIANTKLAKSLMAKPGIKFVDYDYYSPSKEAAAFFVTLVKENGKNIGWIIFQYSINSINSILEPGENLGNTGEIYLVNNMKIMITDSRFYPHSNTMKRRIETTALTKAIEGRTGNEIIEDYRGVKVFSSFEKFVFEGTNWVIVAEIDEDEVITWHFQDNEDYFIQEIYKRLSDGNTIEPRNKWLTNPIIKVDINEYAKAKINETIVTYGVTTCTGVLISYPKKFIYLGHLYPLDSTYYSKTEETFIDYIYKLIDSPFGNKVSDLLGKMIHDLKYYDVYPHEMGRLRVVLVAVHTNSFRNIINKLLEAGLFLSQIKVVYAPQMTYANISSKVDEDYTAVQWVENKGKSKYWTGIDKVIDLGEMVKSIKGYSV